MVRKYKSIKVDGHTMTFTVRYGRVQARIPSITSQILGIGKTKSDAVAEAKDALKVIKRSKNI